jgi:hypothetical protein
MSNTQETALYKTPGERLRYLRSLTRLDRKSFGELYDIPVTSLRLWETSKAPITTKALNRCVKSFLQEGINVKYEWIQDGIGDTPKHDRSLLAFNNDTTDPSSIITTNIADDFSYFRKTYPGCVLYEITTEEMAPVYKKGDFVLGIINTKELKAIHTKDCIIQLTSGQVRFRRVFITTQNTINLYSTNQLDPAEPIINAKIESIAPVIMHYKI